MITNTSKREVRIAIAFMKALPKLTPLVGKVPGPELKERTFKAIRKQVPGVTIGVVTRTLNKLGNMLEWRIGLDKLKRKKRRKRPRT